MIKNFKTLAKDWVNNQVTKFPRSENYKALRMCETCHSFNYKNSWHFEKPSYSNEDDLDQKIIVSFTQCPSCLQQEDAVYDKELNMVMGIGR